MNSRKINKNQLSSIARRYDINTIYLFGSQASGKNTRLSDFDFAVIFNNNVRESDYGRRQIKIISELSRFTDNRHIDLIILNYPRTPLLLKYNVIKDGRVLYCKNKKARVFMEVEILRRWLDWQYFEKMWGDIYVKRVAEGKF